MRIPILAISLSILPALASSGKGQEQDWAKAMFSETSHDYGVVAAGAKVEYKFTIENIYEEDAHIKSVESSCGCTSAKIDKQFLKTWEKATLTAVVNTDTRQYYGRKDTTITVKFDLPFPALVQVHIHAYIRRDVVVQPGVVQFGSVSQGAAVKQNVSVSYAGREDWRIERVESSNPYLECQATDTSRVGGVVKYNLLVTLKANAPAGYIQDQLILVTNDVNPRSARVPVPVEGVISQALSVRPSPLFMGVIEAGQPVTKPLVIQGKMPFRITAVRTSDPRFRCKPPDGAKPVQLLPVTFDAKDASGKITGKIHIETDYPNAKPLDVDVNVQVTPKTMNSG
ncbi:MAG: DUF1573 domain-containing protein [Thermoguttaceae bacterium]|jgi:hypothetical protein